MLDWKPCLGATIPKSKLLKRAVREWQRENDRCDEECSLPRWMLERLCVNYIRHKATDYDTVLSIIAQGKRAANDKLRAKCVVLEAIMEQYPWLEKECRVQLSKARRGFEPEDDETYF